MKWLIGGMMLLAVVMVERSAFSTEGVAQPPAPPAAQAGGFEIDEMMPARKEKGKARYRNKEVEIEVFAAAGRRIRLTEVVLYVNLQWQSEGSYLGGSAITATDAAALVQFIEKPMGSLPPEAAKGELALVYRTWSARDCFGRDREGPSIYLQYRPGTGELSGTPGFDPKAFIAALRAALKDIETLKTWPVK